MKPISSNHKQPSSWVEIAKAHLWETARHKGMKSRWTHLTTRRQITALTAASVGGLAAALIVHG